MQKQYFLSTLFIALLLTACNPNSTAPSVTPTDEQTTATPSSSTLRGTVTVNRARLEGNIIQFSGKSSLADGLCVQTQLFENGVPVTWWPINECITLDQGEWSISVTLGEQDAPQELAEMTPYTVRAWAFDNPELQSELFFLDIAPPPTPSMPTATPTPTPQPNGLLPTFPITPPPPEWIPTRLPPFAAVKDTPESRVRAYIELVTALLNSQDSIDAVFEQLTAWMPQDSAFEGPYPESAWAEQHDLDDDGIEEWIISVPAPESSCWVTVCPAYVLIYEKRNQLFIPLHIIATEETLWEISRPQLLMSADVNADQKTELVLQEDICGAHTCFTSLIIGQWDGAQWYNLSADRIEQAYTDYKIADEDYDGVFEITMHGGTFASVGAGLQRQHTLTFDWRNNAYRLVNDRPDPDAHPYYRMLDANTALAAGDLDAALKLALGVLNQEETPDDVTPEGMSRMISYATIEGLLVYAKRDNLPAMETLYNDLKSRPLAEPDNVYIDAAATLVETYRQTNDALAACLAAEATVAERAANAMFFEWYGYNTERINVGHICPLDDIVAPGGAEL